MTATHKESTYLDAWNQMRSSLIKDAFCKPMSPDDAFEAATVTSMPKITKQKFTPRTWRKELHEVMIIRGDSMGNIVDTTLALDVLDAEWTEIKEGFNLLEYDDFYVWTEEYVYRPILSDNYSSFVVSCPRNPMRNPFLSEEEYFATAAVGLMAPNC